MFVFRDEEFRTNPDVKLSWYFMKLARAEKLVQSTKPGTEAFSNAVVDLMGLQVEVLERVIDPEDFSALEELLNDADMPEIAEAINGLVAAQANAPKAESAPSTRSQRGTSTRSASGSSRTAAKATRSKS